MKNTTKIIALCSDAKCGHTLSIPLLAGSVLPGLDPYCRKCDSIYIVSRIEGGKITSAGGGSFGVGNKFVTSKEITISPSHFSGKSNEEFKSYPMGGHNIFTGFVNRLTPLFVLTQIIKECQFGGEAELPIVIEKWQQSSDSIRNHLQLLESNFNAGRGERLSDGFPSANPERDGPMKIFLRNALGTNGRYILPGRGWLQKLGLVERIDATTMCLTEKAKKVLNMPDLRQAIYEARPRIEGDQPPLVVFIPEEIAEQMLEIISKLLPDEFNFAIDILTSIRDAQDTKLGWNSNNHAPMIVEQSLRGQYHSRWMHHNGTTPLFEMYLEKGYKFKADKKRKGKHKVTNPETFAQDRLLNHVNSTLGGQLSRLKELGLIYPVRVGREKNFHLTDFGRRYLAANSQEQEAEE